nr:uncharacterized protein LOC128705520 [Cherax quadricarinatus]
MAEQELLVRSANDITETWVLNLLQYHHHHNLSGIGGTVRLRKWCLQDLKSKETLGGGCSSRVIVKVEYEVMGDVEHPATTEEQLKEETFVVKTVPSQGVMVDMLTSEGLHHSEVNQYGKFLRVLVTWEAERRGVDVGMMAEIVPSQRLGSQRRPLFHSRSTRPHTTWLSGEYIHGESPGEVHFVHSSLTR